MFDKITKRIISFMTTAVMATSNVMPLTSIIAEENEPDLTYQSMELYPNGEEAEQIVTLDGMMPEDAEAEVIDVSADHEGIAAYDITIKDGRKEYQPDEENPIKVEITDPVITESVTLWHIHDDGDREQILNYAVEDGKVSFYATGFSVYEIVEKTYNIDISYDKVPVTARDTSFSVINVDTDTVDPISDFTYSIEPKTSPKLIEKITSIEQLEAFDLTKTGFYLSSAGSNKGKFAKGYITTLTRSGIAVSGQLKDKNNIAVDNDKLNTHQLLYQAVHDNNAVPFYFESTGTENQYYIYCSSDDGITKNYISYKSGNALKFADNQNSRTIFDIYNYNNAIAIKTVEEIENSHRYWNNKNQSETDAFVATDKEWPDNSIWFWYYALDHELETDPYRLDGKTYGLIKNNYAMTAEKNNNANELKTLQVTSGEGSYSSPYAVTGWTFKWVEGTDTYKISANTENGNTEKYLQLTTNGIQLVDESEASALTVTLNHDNGKIKLSLPQDNLSLYYDNKLFKKANTDTVDANRDFDLVDVSASSTDALNLDNKTYALINRNNSNGYALLAAADGTTKLKAQTVTARTNDAGKTEYVFFGDLSQWTFHHIDYNRYTISNGTQYLKLVNESLTVTDYPYILTVVAGSGDNEGKIKICNSTDQRAIKGTFQSDTISSGCWFDLAIVPEAPAEEIYDLDGITYGLAGTNSNKYYAMSNIAASSTQLSANLLTYNTADETFKCADSLITGWTFHWQNKVSYTISTIAEDGSTKFLKADNNGVYLVDETDASTFYIMKDDDGKIKICDSATGKNIYWRNNVFAQANDSNDANRYFQLLNIDNQNDPYDLDGETYGLMYYENGTYGNALMDSDNNTKLNQIVIREYEKSTKLNLNGSSGITDWQLEPTDTANKYRLKANNGKYLSFNSTNQTISLANSASGAASFEVSTQPDGTTLLYANGKAIIRDGLDFYKANAKGKELYVNSNSDITDWTFENVTEDKYRLKSNGGKYLKMDGDTITMTDSESEATAFKVIPQDGAVMLSAGGKKVYFDGTNFIADTTGSVLKFVQKKTISGEEQLAYSAHAVSIAEPQDGDQVIVYTRVWNNDQKEYEYYAIDYDGSLKRIYPSGNKLVWLDNAVNTLMWEFTVYHYDDGRENGYYELKNTDSDLYIAPQKAKNGQENILQGGTLGIQLPGRTNGEYYSDIIAWDEDDYEYAAIKGDKELGKIKSTYFTDSDKTWYFAVLDESDEDTLHTVDTVDNTEHGITMRMYDFTNTRGNINGAQNKLIGSATNGNMDPVKNLLSTDLKENGYPDTLKREGGGSLKDLFNAQSTAIDQTGFGVHEVNHLFIESIYNTTGYFEFDSCQNTATLVPGGSPVQQTDKDGNPLYVDAEGKLTTELEGNTPIYNFTVYKELGTHDESSINTRKHGQFFPYNILIPGEYSKENPQNLYNALAQELPDDDPRKYENLYHFAKPDGTVVYDRGTGSNSPNMVNCYNGMEMEASFLQTPSGKDAWGHDVIFEFTGDDDFWLYVDGELVIDLGGVHSALAGKVNFATGRVEVNGVKTTLKKVFYDNYKDRNNTKDEALQKLLFNHYRTEYDTYLASQALQYLRSQYTDTTMSDEDLISAHQTEYDKYINSHNKKKEKFEYLKSKYYSESFITDNQDEYNGYLSTQHTTEEAQEYVDEIFEWNGDYYDGTIDEDQKQYVFKDYTEHNMKIFYMERGAGASNLHMRFNLSSVTEGHVLFNKTVKDMDGNNINNPDFDLNTLEFPFKIQYKAEENDDWIDLRNRDSYDNYVPQVTYQGSTQRVDFADIYVSPRDTSKTYNNVYFLTPGKSLDIDFPDDAVFYRICECAVDPSIFKVATNGEGELTDEFGNTVIESGNIQDLYTQSVQVREQPNIKFENRINTENIRHLDITKYLYNDQAKTARITDDTTFNFRLYLSNGTSSVLSLAQLRKYYVLDESGNFCKRADGSFVSIGKNNIDSLTNEEKLAVSFYSSMNGSISNIPAGYTVRVPGLIVGTKFMVEERDYENPVGYQLIDFVCVQGYKENETTQTTPERSYSKDEIYQIEENGQLVTKNVENVESAGTIIANHQAQMLINNKKGYGIKVDKLWSDKDFAKYHDDIHTAVYIKNGDTETLLPGSVKTIKSPDTSVLYFFDDLSADTNDTKSIDNYIVYEVEVDGSGAVTKKLTTLSDEDKTLPSSGNSQIFHAGESESEKNPAEYNVLYPELTDDKRVLSDNARYRKIQNKRKGGISVNLYEWNATANPDVALSNGKFKLYRGTGDNKKLLGTFTSDESGNITVIYGFEESGTTVFTLEEVSAPTGFESMPKPIMFKVTGTSDNETGKITFEFCKEVDDWSNPNDEEFNEDDKNQTDGKNWAEYKLTPQGEDEFIAKIDIYNPGFKLKAIKVDSETGDIIQDEGTRFALYRSRETAFGIIKDNIPMTGFENLITGKDVNGNNTIDDDEKGVIEKINNSLPAGTYFLKEISAPSGYEAADEDIGFTISSNGEVSMVNSGQNEYLTKENSTYIISIKNIRTSVDYYFDIEKIIFVDKNIHDSDPEQKFVFKVEQFVEGTTDFTGAPLQVFYVTMNCKDSLTGGYPYANVLPTEGKYTYASADKEVTVTYKTDVSYTFPAAILKGRQTVHVQQDGIYRISEVTEWSGTDYDFWTGSNVYRGYGDGTQDGVAKIADGFKDSKSTGTNVLPANDANCVYIDVKKLKADCFANETATIDGREATRPKASFTNSETEYAFLSSQAYAENMITQN